MSDETPTHLSLDRVIRRATELQMAAGQGEEDGLDDEEILRIGREVGLETTWLARAMAELRAEERLPAAPDDDGWAARLAGPGHVRALRVVEGTPERVEERISEWMVERESLYPVRRRGGHSLWQPSQGLAAQLKRGLSWQGHRYELARVPEVEVGVQPLEEGRVLVALSVDLRSRRTAALVWVGGLPATFGVAVGVPLLVTGAVPVGWGVLAAAAALGVGVPPGTAAARKQHGQEVKRVTLALEGILDRLERGELDPHAR